MLYEENVTFKREWLHLRGKLYYDADLRLSTAVLLCSPHPHMGGDMENNVIVHVARALARRGCAVMTFDYAGAGDSEGLWKNEIERFEFWESVAGSEDYKVVIPDAESAFAHLMDCLPFNPETVLVGGYSFGAIVALRIAARREVGGVFCISAPVGEYDMSFVESIGCPKYFILSDEDMACDVETIEAFCAQTGASKNLSVIQGGGHFFIGTELLLCSTLLRSLEPHTGKRIGSTVL